MKRNLNWLVAVFFLPATAVCSVEGKESTGPRSTNIKPTPVTCKDLPLKRPNDAGVYYDSAGKSSSQVFVAGNTSADEMLLFIMGTGGIAADWPSSLTSWSATGDDLCSDYLLVFMDYPGYPAGRTSVADPKTFSYRDLSAVIDGIVDGVNGDFASGKLTRVHTVAWSFGTFVAQRWIQESQAKVPRGFLFLAGAMSGGANYPGGGELESFGGAAECIAKGYAYDDKAHEGTKQAAELTMVQLLFDVPEPSRCTGFVCSSGKEPEGLPKPCATNADLVDCTKLGPCLELALGLEANRARFGEIPSEVMAYEQRLGNAFAGCSVNHVTEAGVEAVCYVDPGGQTAADGSYCDCGSMPATTTDPCPAARCKPLPADSQMYVITGDDGGAKASRGGDAYILPEYQEKLARMYGHNYNPAKGQGHGRIITDSRVGPYIYGKLRDTAVTQPAPDRY